MTTTLDPAIIRTVRRRRAITGPFTGSTVADDRELCAIARDVLAMDLDDAELALIAKDVADFGYVSIGHIAAVLTWVADQPIETPAFRRHVARCQRCHRELRDPESIALGLGSECRKAVA